MITEDDKFSFKDITLVSKTGKFYFEDGKKYKIEVTHDMFKSLLVLAANMKNKMPSKNQRNSFDYLFNQLEITEDIFTALLYDYEDWTL